MRRRSPTARQLAYRAYQQTEHWKMLRKDALDRDGHRCTKCGKMERLHVHHHTYQPRFEDCTLADVVTLCNQCHRKAHGLVCHNDFYWKMQAMLKVINYIEPPNYVLPPESDWLELAGLIEDEADMHQFEGWLRICAEIRTSRSRTVKNFHLKKQPDGSYNGGADWIDRLWKWARWKRAVLQQLAAPAPTDPHP